MRGFTGVGSNASGTGPKTALNIIGGTTVRPALFEILMGSQQTPADQALQMALKRTTAVGTAGSSPTPSPIDSSDIAAVATLGAGHSAEPTFGVTLLNISMNQRATFRWMANPGFEFKAPATASNGLAMQMVLATAAQIIDTTMGWFE